MVLSRHEYQTLLFPLLLTTIQNQQIEQMIKQRHAELEENEFDKKESYHEYLDRALEDFK